MIYEPHNSRAEKEQHGRSAERECERIAEKVTLSADAVPNNVA
jgi:hypothetical protein